MTSKDVLKVKRLIGHLRTAEKIASDLELTLGNGGEVGSLVGSMADELEVEIGKERTREGDGFKTADCECGLKIWRKPDGSWEDSEGDSWEAGHRHQPEASN